MAVLSSFAVAAAASPSLPRCLFVSSYHQGYAWSDGVEVGLRRALDGLCLVRQFDMDTKRKKSVAQIQDAARQARRLITDWDPDVVITADDHAARYLVAPFYRNAELPFVFCGINGSVTEYGFPYRNVTGMIEVAPVGAMLAEANAIVGDARRVLYIGANTATEHTNAMLMRHQAERLGLQFESQFAASFASWINAYERAQQFDYVIIGSNAGINDWVWEDAAAAIRPLTRRLTVTSNRWMMPVAMIGMTKVPEEQGEWAGKVALQILAGTEPADIPIIANRKWDLYLNTALLESAGLELPPGLLDKGKRVD